jgi:formate hydrogenlyase subunit 3/multisubunit Na+/H+ antiporter MnhD subunit
MHSRQVIQGLLLTAGVAVVALLILPAVHVPFIVVHGPVSALRAQRAALLFQILIQTSALTFAGFCMRSWERRRDSQNELQAPLVNFFSNFIHVMRC